MDLVQSIASRSWCSKIEANVVKRTSLVLVIGLLENINIFYYRKVPLWWLTLPPVARQLVPSLRYSGSKKQMYPSQSTRKIIQHCGQAER